MSGYAHAAFGLSDTELKLADVKGDKTGTLHVTDEQIARAAVVEGIVGTFTTTVNFEIGVTATLHVPETLIVAGVLIDLMGTCTFSKLIVENGGIIKGYTTTSTSTFSGGKYEKRGNDGEYILNQLKLEAGSMFILPSGGLQMTVGTLEMKRFVVLEADFVDIIAVNVILEREAALSTNGRAALDDDLVPLSAHGIGKNGGAHSAAGGVSTNDTVDDASEPYGTIYEPITPGASGGPNNKGGGAIKITTDDLILDGILRSSGGDTSVGGAGAGGSIFVICNTALKGLGSMETKGGSTTDVEAGAGSGGHIAVHMQSDEFQGEYSAGGGNSFAPHGNGGPGSIYLLSDNNGERYICDNENGQIDYYCTLNEESLTLNFDTVDIYNFAKVQMIKDGKDRSINIDKVNGDSTGLVRLQENQIGTLERSVTEPSVHSKLRVNIELHKGGEFIMSETVTILGLGSVAFDLDGVLRGVSNLYLASGRKMRVGENAKIVPFSANDPSAYNYVEFGIFQLEPGSIVEYDADTGAKIKASNINLKFSAALYADSFDVMASNIDLELESEISCSSENRMGSESIDVTTGSGTPGNESSSGSCHGGVGGGSGECISYNSLYEPRMAGSRGTYNDITGEKTGGRGGGWIHIQVGNLLINDGTIAANGEIADDNGGGGSGGSIWIVVYEFEGYGYINAYGGNGIGRNGGGAAGRVAVHCTLEIEFSGTYSVYGGSGSDDSLSAGGGTVYLQDIRYGITYKRLLLDNQGLPHGKYATIDEDFKDHFFNEIHLMNNASLQLVDDNRDSSLECDKFYSDGSGLYHLHKYQTLKVEYDPTTRNAFLAGVNFITDPESYIYFPSIVYVYGTGVFLEGQTERRSMAIFGELTGISDLILGFETLLYFGDLAHTASVDLATGALEVDPVGTVTFGTLDLRSYSQIKYAPDQTVIQKIARIDARFKSVISAESINIHAAILNIEAGATFTASAIDRPNDKLNEDLGQGFDAVINGTEVGTGGGHATKGGGL